MVEVRRVVLPGVGMLHSFTTLDGVELSVIAHRMGARDLIAKVAGNAIANVRLEESEARTVADLLGGTRIVESIAELDDVPGVPIAWAIIDDDDVLGGKPIASLPTVDGVSLVAVVRGRRAIPAPPVDFVVEPGDILVAVGPDEGIQQVFHAIMHGSGEDAEV
ncbi:hypothetical protein FLP10_12870 [Agromyces intestinalis]|uniref:RCK C-terminal domain-containing protein n=1 Tax=Agromyces intestinalis TaxID=2592652 RepID=A0A5C1YGS0_9MICO|nr:TrkA C-terminal domain-containing protein [Agromyces intestinalis]QEO15213.1 hypothetical protein FLP10_12870 [Agromyces intestinalis]